MEKFSPEALEKLARCFRLLMQLPDKEEKPSALTDDPALHSQAVNSDEEKRRLFGNWRD